MRSCSLLCRALLARFMSFSGREDFVLSSDAGMELLLIGLPIFAEQESRATLQAAE